MTNRDAFSADEWTIVREAPTSAGLVVVAASRGGTFRETFAMSKAYVEARADHGRSELLDAVVGAKPKVDHPHPHSPEELTATALQHIRDAIALLDAKATAEEIEEYRQFVLTLAGKVAAAHREHGQDVSQAEAAALEQIRAALGSPAGG